MEKYVVLNAPQVVSVEHSCDLDHLLRTTPIAAHEITHLATTVQPDGTTNLSIGHCGWRGRSVFSLNPHSHPVRCLGIVTPRGQWRAPGEKDYQRIFARDDQGHATVTFDTLRTVALHVLFAIYGLDD